MVGIWSTINDGASWSIEITRNVDSQGEYLRGIIVAPSPKFKTGEEFVVLRPTAVSGVYQGRQKWKKSPQAEAVWHPARVILDQSIFKQYNSVRVNPRVVLLPEWLYIRQSETDPATGIATARDSGRSESEARLIGNGSGFVFNEKGQILTNYHVIGKCGFLVARVGDVSKRVSVVGTDAGNDMAVLGDFPGGHFAQFAEAGQAKLGQTVLVMGYPLQSVLAPSVNLTSGIVSSLAGIRGDSRVLQVSAPIQSGNSGGPLLDSSGHIVGIVSFTLNHEAIAESGNSSENVGFAIKGSTVKGFLDSLQLSYKIASPTQAVDATVIAEEGRRFTALIECRK